MVMVRLVRMGLMLDGPTVTGRTRAQQVARKAGGAAVVAADLETEDGGSVELDSILALQPLNKVGQDESLLAVQELTLVEAVLVHVDSDQDVVAGSQRQLRLGILIGRLAERVVRIPERNRNFFNKQKSPSHLFNSKLTKYPDSKTTFDSLFGFE